MSYKYKLNFYDVKGLTLFPRVLTDFTSSVITTMVPEEPDKISDFTLRIDLSMDKAIIKSNNDFEDVISKFETNGLDYEYYEDTDDEEEVEEEEDSRYILDIGSLTSNKLRTIVIQDLIESVKHLLVKDIEDYYNYDPFLNSIEFDMLNSKITLISDYSLYDSIKYFNSNGLPHRYCSTLGYEVEKWETYLN